MRYPKETITLRQATSDCRSPRSSVAIAPTLVLAFAGLTACQAAPALPVAPSQAVDGSPSALAIHSYNYTDRTISSFYVDGAWGGNVFVSRGNAGGGKSTCCVTWISGTPLPHKYRVRWIADMCVYQVEVGESKEVFDQHKALWKEQDVYLTKPPPPKPENFEVHFYRDGHVEVEITDTYTPPRLKLTVDAKGNRPGVPGWPQCNAEQLRTYKD